MKDKLKKQVAAIHMEMKPMKPMLHVSGDMLPDIKDWNVGKTYTVTIEMKQTGMHESDGKVSGDFEIISIEPEDAKESSDTNEEKD